VRSAAARCASAPWWRPCACWRNWRADRRQRRSRAAKSPAGYVRGWRARREAARSSGGGRRDP